MVKVYLPSFAICTLSLTVNLLVIGTCLSRVMAQESVSPSNNGQTDNVASADVELEILAEINRVRTNPQGYAHWLEDQKQYYDNIWLRLPGEKPIRAHRLKKAIDEAIAVLKSQQPLPPLSASEQTVANANKKLDAFAANRNIQNISYGRNTAQGIVMSLVVDELFPDRRRRNSLLSPDADDTGVVCKSDPRYSKVCAIAYSNSEMNETIADKPEIAPSEKPTESMAHKPESTPKEQPEATAEQPEIAPSEKPAETVTNQAEIEIAEPETINEQPESAISEPTETPETTDIEQEIATGTLPQPPQPQAPPVPVNPDRESSEAAEKNTEAAQTKTEDEIKAETSLEAESEDKEKLTEEVEAKEAEISSEMEPEDEEEFQEIEADSESEAENQEEPVEEVFEADKSASDEEQIATNSDSSRLLENVERGTLEEGDRIIEEDGSFYDSYPLEAKSGESFTIALESDEFDAFVALIDAKGNIIEQNDDINEENSNSRIRVTIPENGLYNVIVNAYDEGGTGDYILTVSR